MSNSLHFNMIRFNNLDEDGFSRDDSFYGFNVYDDIEMNTYNDTYESPDSLVEELKSGCFWDFFLKIEGITRHPIPGDIYVEVIFNGKVMSVEDGFNPSWMDKLNE